MRRSREEIERIKAALREMWPSMWPKEVEQRLGIKGHILGLYARHMGLTHSAIPEEEQRRHKAEIARLNQKKSLAPHIRARAREKFCRTYRLERMRVLSGEKQKTKFRIETVSKRLYAMDYRLRRFHGYFSYEGDTIGTLYYDKDTRRKPLTGRYSEQWYTEKYGFKFIEDNNDYKEEKQ